MVEMIGSEAVRSVWRDSQALIGPQTQARLDAGETVRVAEVPDPLSPTPPKRPLRTFEFCSMPHRPGFRAVFGRIAGEQEWLLVDGPWRI